MTEANPYSPPDETRVETAASDTVVPASQGSWLGAMLLGIFGYFGPFLIFPPVAWVGIHPLTIDAFFVWTAYLHWPVTFVEYLYLFPNVFCLIVFAKAGFLGFPRALLRDPARRYLAAGTLVLISVIAYGIIIVRSANHIGPEPLNVSIYCGFTLLPRFVMLGVLAGRRKAKVHDDV